MRTESGKAVPVLQEADRGFVFPTGMPDLGLFDTGTELKLSVSTPHQPSKLLHPLVDAVSSQCRCCFLSHNCSLGPYALYI